MPLLSLATIRQTADGRWVAGLSDVRVDSDSGVVYAPGGALTPEGGLAVSLVNRTGAPSVKGAAVTAGSLEQGSFELETSQFATIGYVYEAGVPDGEACLVVVAGKAHFLLKDGTAAQRGYLLRPSSDAPGRVEAVVPPSGVGAQATNDHFKEAGHCLEDQAAGVSVLALAAIHFN